MAQEKFEDRLNEVNEALQDILEDCNTELVAKEAEEASALNEVPAKIRSITGGGGAGGADWNAQEGEAGFIENKPFDVYSENTYTVYADMSEPTPVEANKLGYSDVFSQNLGHTVYVGVIPIGAEFPTFNIGDKFKMTYDGVEYEDTVVGIENDAPITENYMTIAGGGTFEQPLFIGCVPMGGWAVMIIDDTLPTTSGSMIDVSDYIATGRTKLGAGKVKFGEGLTVGEHNELVVHIDNSTIVTGDTGYLHINPAFNVPASTETNYPTVQEFNALLTALKNAGFIQPD